MNKKIFAILCMISALGLVLSGCGKSNEFPEPPESVL